VHRPRLGIVPAGKVTCWPGPHLPFPHRRACQVIAGQDHGLDLRQGQRASVRAHDGRRIDALTVRNIDLQQETVQGTGRPRDGSRRSSPSAHGVFLVAGPKRSRVPCTSSWPATAATTRPFRRDDRGRPHGRHPRLVTSPAPVAPGLGAFWLEYRAAYICAPQRPLPSLDRAEVFLWTTGESHLDQTTAASWRKPAGYRRNRPHAIDVLVP